MRPVVENLAEVAAVAPGQVHALGLCPDLVPTQTGLSDGRGVDEGRQFLHVVSPRRSAGGRRGASAHLDVLRQQAVEEMDVGGLEVDEVLELLNGRRLHGQKPKA